MEEKMEIVIALIAVGLTAVGFGALYRKPNPAAENLKNQNANRK